MQRYCLSLFLMLTTVVVFGQRKIKGDGNVVKETRRVGNFDQIVIKGAFEVVLRQSDRSIVEVVSDENLQDYIRTDVREGVLILAQEEEFSDATEQKIYIEVEELVELTAEGASEINSENAISGRGLTIQVSGAAKAEIMVNTNSFNAQINGAGLLQLAGKTGEATLDISGAGNINAYELKARSVSVELSGAGAAQVYASDMLDVSISGLGAVNYDGNPEIRKSIGGLGTVSRRKD